ncbi:MAG: hypothetical protein A3F83_16210 [Candidatus Glassbacteria bacterium RIFCSPLOWO2_12_FULL_58_11]|uniref:Calcineurin-like phosphoesterase domain-containing protein n=1 Tax=Candidatus Glassbacteria bacterium RIFCSPLOWO2_12_FULL_58_11 TaxID=1817867 RepID=A0A1F5Z2Q7_9BACT|nr:MAG: hypothetical protein A3F83_16210 [Candidatus Glassbacteria bacterium RIFCSPLOWO2_12_FULL_58_11]
MSELILALFSALALAVVFEMLRNLRIRFRTLNILIPSSGEPGRDSRYSILHISDIHLTRDSLSRLEPLRKLAGREWDFILITGDLIDDDSGIAPVCKVLGALKARYGKFAVLGNHDYTAYRARNPWQWLKLLSLTFYPVRFEVFCAPNAIDRLAGTLERNGIRLLRNELAEGWTESGEAYQIFGIDDPSTNKDDPAPLYGSVRENALRLVIMHSPRRVESVKPFQPDLVLCGHTHGGQIRLPFFGAISTHSDAPRRACAGLTNLAGCRMHISPGMGAGRVLPFRILAPPEITEIVLEIQSGATRSGEV